MSKVFNWKTTSIINNNNIYVRAKKQVLEHYANTVNIDPRQLSQIIHRWKETDKIRAGHERFDYMKEYHKSLGLTHFEIPRFHGDNATIQLKINKPDELSPMKPQLMFKQDYEYLKSIGVHFDSVNIYLLRDNEEFEDILKGAMDTFRGGNMGDGDLTKDEKEYDYMEIVYDFLHYKGEKYTQLMNVIANQFGHNLKVRDLKLSNREKQAKYREKRKQNQTKLERKK